jgi:hypothetical protein
MRMRTHGRTQFQLQTLNTIVFNAHNLRYALSLVLAFLLALPPGLGAQPPQTPVRETPVAPLPTIQNLKVLVLAGQGDQNDLERRVMAPLVVQVLDPNDQPVEGADVVFRFPLAGATATFENQQSARTVKTDSNGQARATNWVANAQVGNFQVHVTATFRNQMGQATVLMSNVTRIVEGKNKSHHWWSSKTAKILIVAVAAGAIAGIVLATRGGGKSTTTVTISPGAPTLGGPQ